MSIFLFLILSISRINTPISGDGYKGLIPLKSTCKNVEKLFGTNACGQDKSEIKLDNEIIIIRYARKVCDESSGHKWNVSVGTVLSLERQLDNKPIKMTDFNIRWQSLEKIPVKSDIEEEYYFKDSKTGTMYHVINSYVHRIYYYAFPKSLECKEQNNIK